jgi:hypothetical protein
MTAELSMAEILEAARATWPVTPHPFLPWLGDADLAAKLVEPAGPAAVAALYAERRQRMFLETEDGDAYRYAFELPHWKDADALLRQYEFLYVAGGKRASKSEWAAKRTVQAAMEYPRGKIWCLQASERTSISAQQQLIWKYLPLEIKARNGKSDPRKVWKVNYSQAGGFTDRIIVLPNRTEIHFLTYGQECKTYQGWDIGAHRPEGGYNPLIPNIGAWADEDMNLPWLETIKFRSTTRTGKMIWTFSTMEGITSTIKEFLGSPRTVQTRHAELLANRINLPGLPVGEMPYIQVCSSPKSAAIYFHSDLNLFGDNYENVKTLCAGKSSAYIEENAYGYARDVMNKAFPLFGGWNVVDPKNVPRTGTNYQLTDPAGARNWATIWVRVAPGGDHYIYRDWPDAQTYGEWAVPSKDPKQPDGDAGPAQKSIGLGINQYKELFRTLETKISVQASTATGSSVASPHREVIFDRYIDPRAGRNPHIDDEGGTCIIDEFLNEPDPLEFRPASGVERSTGITHVNTLLYFEKEKPLVPILNAPKLFVSADCLQVIWMFSNYTDRGGEKGGCKDFADLVRYMGLADLQYYEKNEYASFGGGKGY